MRAMNLIPLEQRRGGAGAPTRTGSGVYALLGALGVLVILVGAWVLAGNTVSSRESELVSMTQEAQQAQAEAEALKPYREFDELRRARVSTVAQLAASRFDWDTTFGQLAKVVPGNVWLTSLTGTIAPGVNFESAGSGGGDTGSLRQSLPVPALEIVGCTESQSEVPRMMARLRLIDGVTRVSLASSSKVEATAGGSGGSPTGGSSGDCRNGKSTIPKFEMVAFFEPKSTPGPGAPGAADTPQTVAQPAAGQAPAQPTTQAAPAGGSK